VGRREHVVAGRIAVAALMALLVAAGLHRLTRADPHLTMPSAPVVAALAGALATAAFGSRLWGVVLLAPVALLSLPWFGHPFGLAAAVVTAGMSVAEVALWSIWLPLTLRGVPTSAAPGEGR
jgi:hypothetical protein